jgi:RNA polymerase sigma-70 factor (ECF subfamily)
MSAGETADILGVTVPAVKSMLQRARARMADQPGLRNERAHDLQPGRRAWLLEQYLTAFERSDPAMLERVLTEDARLELPPDGWFSGKQDCMTVLREAVGRPGDWRMLPDSFNGRPGVAAYLRDAAGRHQAYGIAVLEVTEDGINAITVFGEPDLLTRFGFPAAA